MSFREFVNQAREYTSSALTALNLPVPETIEWDETPDPTLGDLSLRIGFQLAKQLKKRPSEVAGILAAKISESIASGKASEYIAAVEAHPSGFLNFKINYDRFLSGVLSASLNRDYGRLDIGRGEPLILEHTAVNPNKALHVGHLRNVTLGDSISKIFEFAGYNPFVINYIDDSGLQVADIIVGMLHLGYSRDAPPGVKYDHYAGDTVYVGVNRSYDVDPALKEKQRVILKAIEDRDEKIFPVAAEVTDKILREQLSTCWRMGVFYDLLVYESDVVHSKLWEYAFSEMKSKGIAHLETEGKYVGCWIVSVSGEKEGEDKVLVRADGTATYIAKDLPFAGLKVGVIPDRFTYTQYARQPNSKQLWRSRSDSVGTKASPVPWGSGRSITVIDARQSRLQRIIQHILEQISSKDLEGRYIHLGYAIISLSPRTASTLMSGTFEGGAREQGKEETAESGVVTMSGRRGTYVNVDDVLEAVKKRALEETRKRNQEDSTDEAWLDHVAEKLAISAIKFSLLKQDLDKMIIFDLEDSLQLIGETGPYMLYTYARASSISSKSSESVEHRNSEKKISGGLLSSESEIALVKKISKFDLYLEKSVRMMAPKWIAHYSFELCEDFNKFYEKNRVIQEEDPDKRRARLALVESFRMTLRRALALLGIETLERI